MARRPAAQYPAADALIVRPHPDISPRITRPTRGVVQLAIAMAPENGDPRPDLRIILDRRAGLRLLADLMAALSEVWEPEIAERERGILAPGRTTNHGV